MNTTRKKDATLARHVMDVHMGNIHARDDGTGEELTLELLKKYIAYCKNTCGPRLSASAAEKLKTHYVQMRNGSKNSEDQADKKSVIPITIRQLEAVVRISESLAKMQLQPFVSEANVDEALRLFKVSTLAAAHSGDLSGAEGFTTEEEHSNLIKIEKQIKRRFNVNTQLSEKSIIEDLTRQGYAQPSIFKVIHCMIRRNELQYRGNRKYLYRLK